MRASMRASYRDTAVGLHTRALEDFRNTGSRGWDRGWAAGRELHLGVGMIPEKCIQRIYLTVRSEMGGGGDDGGGWGP